MLPLLRRATLALLALALLAPPLAAQTGGTVVAWGDDSFGQATVPAGLTGVTAVAAGFSHSLALKADGTVVGWGSDAANHTAVPAGISGVIAVAAGGGHVLALKADGTVATWGANSENQATVPAGLSGVTAVAAGFSHSLALKSDGTVVAWGDNTFSQTTLPARLSGVAAVETSVYHSLALRSDGTVVAWGDNRNGQSDVPAGLTGVTAVAAGFSHSLALKADGTVVGWGAPPRATVPAGLTGVTAVAAGLSHSLALKSDGTVVAWGDNSDNQTTVPAGLSSVTAVAAGDRHSLAIVEPGPTLAVAAPKTLYWPTETVALSAVATRADGLGLVAATLGYDAARVAFVAPLAAGPLITSAPSHTVDAYDDPAAGEVEFTVERTGPAGRTGATGDGAVATASFRVEAAAEPGPLAFTLSRVVAEDAAAAPFQFATVEGGEVQVGGVWPGDFNRDCTVNNDDSLYLFSVYGATGPARPGPATVAWQAHAFEPWGPPPASDGFKKTFADGNGNGAVADDDIGAAVGPNFFETRTAATGCTPPRRRTGTPKAIALEGPVGSTVSFEVALSGAVTDLLGTHVTLTGQNATVTAVEPGALFPGAFAFSVDHGGATYAVFGHRGAANAVTGSGSLFRVTAQIDGPNASLTVEDLVTADPSGAPSTVDPSGPAVTTTAPVATSATEGPSPLAVAVSPNPASGAASVALSVPEAGPVVVAVFDALGREVARVERAVAAGRARVALPVERLAPGLYVVRVAAEAEVVSRTLTVAR